MSTARRLALLGAASLAALAIVPFIGKHPVGIEALMRPAGTDVAAVILWQIRIPRALAAFLGGAGLALGGAVFQAMFRNPLATPYTLGVASGASLGVALASRLGLVITLGLGVATTPIAAFAGAMAAVALVWIIAWLRPGFSSTVLLLAGVALSFFFSSLILFVQYTASLGDSYRIVRWLMGGLAATDWPMVTQMAPLVGLGAAMVLLHFRELDLLAAGPEIAAARGVGVARCRKVLFLATSLMVGGVVASCGPVGFVGMMAPHICRLLLGSHHRFVLPAAAMFGGAFLTLCDTIARTVVAPVELPVGVITAFLGGPFFLWLLLRRGSTHLIG